DTDVYVIKTNATGDTLWTHTFGGSSADSASSIEQTTDGGYIIAGGSKSFSSGISKIYLIKTDAEGRTPCYHSTTTALIPIMTTGYGGLAFFHSGDLAYNTATTTQSRGGTLSTVCQCH